MNPLLNRMHTIAESADHIQGFLVYRSYGGGTGSGLTSAFLENLAEEYPKTIKIEFPIYPSPNVSK